MFFAEGDSQSSHDSNEPVLLLLYFDCSLFLLICNIMIPFLFVPLHKSALGVKLCVFIGICLYIKHNRQVDFANR